MASPWDILSSLPQTAVKQATQQVAQKKALLDTVLAQAKKVAPPPTPPAGNYAQARMAAVNAVMNAARQQANASMPGVGPRIANLPKAPVIPAGTQTISAPGNIIDPSIKKGYNPILDELQLADTRIPHVQGNYNYQTAPVHKFLQDVGNTGVDAVNNITDWLAPETRGTAKKTVTDAATATNDLLGMADRMNPDRFKDWQSKTARFGSDVLWNLVASPLKLGVPTALEAASKVPVLGIIPGAARTGIGNLNKGVQGAIQWGSDRTGLTNLAGQGVIDPLKNVLGDVVTGGILAGAGKAGMKGVDEINKRAESSAFQKAIAPSFNSGIDPLKPFRAEKAYQDEKAFNAERKANAQAARDEMAKMEQTPDVQRSPEWEARMSELQQKVFNEEFAQAPKAETKTPKLDLTEEASQVANTATTPASPTGKNTISDFMSGLLSAQTKNDASKQISDLLGLNKSPQKLANDSKGDIQDAMLNFTKNHTAQEEAAQNKLDLVGQRTRDQELYVPNKMDAWQSLRATISPMESPIIRDRFPDFKDTHEEWFNANKEATKNADYLAQKYNTIDPKDGWKYILGLENPSKAQQEGLDTKYLDNIRGEFDNLYGRAKEAGLDMKYLENYVAQIWNDGSPKAKEIIKGLGTKPFFTKERMIRGYEEGVKLGLVPKYTHPAQILGYYSEKLDQAIANKRYFDSLESQGLIAPADIVSKVDGARQAWQPLRSPFIPTAPGGIPYMAPAEVAKVLNNVFREPNSMSGGWNVVKAAAGMSKWMQKLTLSEGVKTINSFGLGQLYKEVMSGNGGRAIKVWSKALFTGKKATNKYMEANKPTVDLMAKNGLYPESTMSYKDITDYTFKVGKEALQRSLPKKFANTLFFSSDDATFKQYMPMIQTEIFKKFQAKNEKLGLDPEAAAKLTAQQVKKYFGVIEDKLTGRSPETKALLGATLMAPKFREGMVTSIGNSLKSIVHPKDKTLDISRNQMKGFVGGFVLYQALNYALNGQSTFESNDDDSKKFDLKVPLGGGEVMYIPFFPSIFFTPRTIASAGLDISHGDFKGAATEAAKFASMPIATGAEVLNNKDYRGKPIYDEEKGPLGSLLSGDPTAWGYTLGKVGHPFVKTAISAATGSASPLQNIVQALGLPAKFATETKFTGENKKVFDAYVSLQDLQFKTKRAYAEGDDAGAKKYEGQLNTLFDGFTDKDFETLSLLDQNKVKLSSGDYKKIQAVKDQQTQWDQDVKGKATPAFDGIYNLYKKRKSNQEITPDEITSVAKQLKTLSPYELDYGYEHVLKNYKVDNPDDYSKLQALSQKIMEQVVQ